MVPKTIARTPMTSGLTVRTSAGRLGFNPASPELFSRMTRFDPLTYRSPHDAVLPFAQTAERRAMHEIRTQLKAENDAALVLGKIGHGELWNGVLDDISTTQPKAIQKLMRATLRGALSSAHAWSARIKQEHLSPRPFQADPWLAPVGRTPADTSHPSGHAAAAYAAAMVLGSFVPEQQARLLDIAANVARSRVVLGMHYPGDVAEGARLGVRVAKNILELDE